MSWVNKQILERKDREVYAELAKDKVIQKHCYPCVFSTRSLRNLMYTLRYKKIFVSLCVFVP